MTSKKERSKRREMERAVYLELSDDKARAQYIEDRKQRSKERFQQRNARRLFLTEGFQFIQKDLKREYSDIRYFTGYILGYQVTAAALLRTGEHNSVFYHVSFTICSPADKFDWVIAKQYLGWRFQKDCKHPYKFFIPLREKGALKTARLAQLIRSHIELDAVSARIPMPKHMMRNAMGAGTSKYASQLQPIDLKFTLPKRRRKRRKAKTNEERKSISV